MSARGLPEPVIGPGVGVGWGGGSGKGLAVHQTALKDTLFLTGEKKI